MSKQSNRTRSFKSKHKHDYRPCLIKTDRFRTPALGSKCSICGKVKIKTLFISEKSENGCYKLLNAEEVYLKYSELPIEYE